MAEQEQPSGSDGSPSEVARKLAVVANGALTDQVSTEALNVLKPAAGQTSAVHVSGDQRLALSFPLDNVKVEMRDVDLVLTFPDGSTIFLLDFGLRLLSENTAPLVVDGQVISPQAMLALVRDFVPSDVLPPASATPQDAPKVLSVASDKPEPVQPDAPPPPAPAPEPKSEPVKAKADDTPQDKTTHVGDYTDPLQIPPPAKPVFSSNDVASSSSKKVVENIHTTDDTHTSDSTHTSDATPAPTTTDTDHTNPVDTSGVGPGKYDVPVPTITAALLGIVDSQTIALPSGGQEIHGALAVVPADTNVSYAAQAAVDTITGTVGNDLIYADDPKYASAGTSSRLVSFTTTLPGGDWVITGAKISGLPDGYAIVGATLANGAYVVAVDPSDPSHLDIKLQYVLPDGSTAADAQGFHDLFGLKIDFDITSPSLGVNTTTTGTVAFGVRDVAGEADASYTDPLTGQPVYVLWSTPPGTVVHAGAGNDTVMAGAGVDVLDGGSGTNLLSYKLSNAAVTVDLAANQASGGYAHGDTISNFQSVEGSAFADHLTGDAGSNTLVGGAGADTLEGGGGNDTADYSASKAGVTVDLVAGSGRGGDAEHDVLVSIENVTGSAFDDRLTAVATGSVLLGGAGADTLVAGAGVDSLDGGAGTDTADYSASTAAIVVNLATGTHSGGAADGDLLVSIESVIGSAYADKLTVAAGGGALSGGAGNDTLVAGAGADTLDGGTGTDTADYSASAAAIFVNLGASAATLGGVRVEAGTGTGGLDPT